MFASSLRKVLSEDIHLLKQIRVTLDATKISIVDARSMLNAKANQVYYACARFMWLLLFLVVAAAAAAAAAACGCCMRMLLMLYSAAC